MNDIAERTRIETSLRLIDDMVIPVAPSVRMATLLSPDAESPAMPLPSAENQDAGAVLQDSVVAFTGGLSDQNRDDVSNSLMLGQLVASHKYDREKEAEQWYRVYNDSLATMGWLTTSRALQSYSPSQSSFTMDEVALEIIAQVGGANFVQVARKAVNALAANENALRVFENSGTSEQLASFKFLPCVQTPQNDVVMMLNFMNFTKTVSTRKVLFFKFTSEQVKITRSADQVQLNAGLYNQYREAVSKKLGHNGLAAIAGFEI